VKISVALATYQGERYLRQQLQSIAGQVRPPDELLVGDDRSSDATAAIVEGFADLASFPVGLHLNDRRLGTARNFEAVIQRCTGDVVALADQDDIWHPSKLEQIQRAVEQPRAPGLVFSDCALIDEESRSLGTTGWRSVGLSARDRNAITHGNAFRRLVQRQRRFGGTVTGATLAFRARYRDLILPFPEFLSASGKGLLHDSWIALVVSAVAPIEAIPALLVQHRQHPDQQIGMVAAAKPSRFAGASGSRDRAGSFEDSRRWLVALHSRLETAADEPRRDMALAELDRWVHHLDVRATLSERRLRRLRPVTQELATGRYHACSSGFRSAARDLIR
jgi:glycosyltransferase involved in cell wall biosynthesis